MIGLKYFIGNRDHLLRGWFALEKTAENYRELGERLNRLLILRYSPIALKLLYSEDEIPENSMRPLRDRGGHLSMCQAYAMVRRERRTITMCREDHWCVWPLVSYGLVDLDDEDLQYMGSYLFFKDRNKGIDFLKNGYPRLDTPKKPVGFCLAPLESTEFVPDLITVYCRPAQLRSIMMAVRFETGEQLQVCLDSVDSCVHSSIPVLNGKDYNITIPDPGEYERALVDEDEMMFTLRPENLEAVIRNLEMLSKSGFGYKELAYGLEFDTPRPEFYNKMYQKWNLDTGKKWHKP